MTVAFFTSDTNVLINVSPTESHVFIDGILQKSTTADGSLSIKLSREKHSIKIISPGYKALETVFKADPWGRTKHEYSLEKGVTILPDLPYEDKGDNFYIYGYYGTDYKATYRVMLFNPDAKALSTAYLNKRGVSSNNAEIIFIEEYDLGGEAAPN